MKKKLTLLTFALSIFSLSGIAQIKTASIQGKVVDGQQKPAEAITVSLLIAKDSSISKQVTTDKSGSYNFQDLRSGQYLVQASSTGAEKVYSNRLLLSEDQPEITLPALTIVSITKELGGVTVIGRKSFIEQQMDKTVVNVDAAVTNAGLTVMDVLEKSPGVAIDKDGTISMKGKQGVIVMMDGRPTYLTTDQLANLLKSMPASSVDQIELITNPTSKYDAAGNSGIINIRTKKNRQKGFNGNATANYGQGQYWKTNNSLNLNYRNGKFHVFANGGYSVWNGFQELEIERKYRDAGSKELTAIFEQTSKMKHHNTNYNFKIGTDYYLDKKTTIGFVLNGNWAPEEQKGKNIGFLKNNIGNVDSIIISTSSTNDHWKNKSANLNFRRQFDSSGRELTADLDYVSYISNSNQLFENSILHSDWTTKSVETLRGYLPVNIDIYTGKVDYSHPLKANAKLETGLKGSYVNTENLAQYYNINDGIETIDYKKTNQFHYTEKIIAAYVNFNKHIRKWNFQSGLRFEQTIMDGKQFGNPTQPDSSFERSYGSLFPTLYVGFTGNKNNEFAISYGRRIDRPAYQDLNPFLFYIDKFTYGRGNPYLKPQFTNNFELSHTYKSFLTTTLNYSYTKDFINESFTQGKEENGEDKYATIVSQGNIGIRQNGGVAISAQVPVRKWWSAMLYGNYNYTMFSGLLNGEEIDVEGGNLSFNVNNQFNFKKGWSAELSGWYRTKGVEGQIILDPMGALSTGISKQVLKGKGTIKLNARDIFYTQIAKGTINFQGTEAWFRNSRDSRVVNISFIYRFGKPMKDAPAKRQTGGAGDEENRVKMGGNN